MLADELIALYDAAREAPPFTQTRPGLTPQAGYEAAAAPNAAMPSISR